MRNSNMSPASGAVGVRGYRIRDLAKAQERRREILVGAARAFAHGGYVATNVDQIARECGLARGHIYHYFRSTEEIFTEIRADAVSRLIERLATILEETPNSPEFAGIVRSGIEEGVFVAGDEKLLTFVIMRGALTVANWYRKGGKLKPQFIVKQVTDQLVRSKSKS